MDNFLFHVLTPPFPQTPGAFKYFLSVGASNHDQDLKIALDFPEYILTILSKVFSLKAEIQSLASSLFFIINYEN